MAVKEESIERESEGRECVSLFSLFGLGERSRKKPLIYGGFLLFVQQLLVVIIRYQTPGWPGGYENFNSVQSSKLHNLMGGGRKAVLSSQGDMQVPVCWWKTGLLE